MVAVVEAEADKGLLQSCGTRVRHVCAEDEGVLCANPAANILSRCDSFPGRGRAWVPCEECRGRDPYLGILSPSCCRLLGKTEIKYL